MCFTPNRFKLWLKLIFTNKKIKNDAQINFSQINMDIF